MVESELTKLHETSTVRTTGKHATNFVPGKHATMITQVGVSPSTITNWAISLKGLVIWDIENNDLADAQIGG